MARRWISSPLGDWQPLCGSAPQIRLDTHPSGEYVAMQVLDYDQFETERAAVWSTRSKQIVWQPDNAKAISWTLDGAKALVITESHRPTRREGIPKIRTPLQADISYHMDVFLWESRKQVSDTIVTAPTGWFVDLVAAPSGELAAAAWNDQTEAGIELIALSDQPRQLKRRGYFGPTPYMYGPVFTADSGRVLCTFGKDCWWAADPEKQSPGGKRLLGWLVIGDIERKRYTKQPIRAEVPKGWAPADPDDDIRNNLLPFTVSGDSSAVRIELPTSEVATVVIDIRQLNY
jgi:hypothetical protein